MAEGAREADFASLQGVWRSQGYGNVLVIGPRGYTLHEETRVSCLPVFEGSLDELAEHYADVRVSPRGQAFRARRAAGVTRTRFRRLMALPRRCAATAAREPADPEFNFEVFWHTFAEHYALFGLKGIDWDRTYGTHRPRVHARTRPGELFEVFMDMVRPLGDAHVQLHTSRGHFDAGADSPLHDRLARELDRADDARDVGSFLAELREWLRDTIREQYLAGGSHRSPHGLLEWGPLDDDTGYLAIRAMAGLSGELGRPRGDAGAVDEAMTRVQEELGGLGTLVVDLRGNGGGYDSVALRLAGHLVDRKRMAFAKSARRGAGFTGRQPIHVEPLGGPRFAGRLVVLTSGLTASAAEVFILALLQHPRLVLVGETTHGILSDAMERHLPNGWFLTLSNEIYHASDGELYEDRGIPPHVEIPFLDRRSRHEGRDPMLDHVLGR